MAEMAESRCTLGNEMAECSNLAETLKYKTNLFAHQLKDEVPSPPPPLLPTCLSFDHRIQIRCRHGQVEELRQMAASAKRTWSREEVEMTRDSLYFSRSEAEQLIDSLGEVRAAVPSLSRPSLPDPAPASWSAISASSPYQLLPLALLSIPLDLPWHMSSLCFASDSSSLCLQCLPSSSSSYSSP